MLISKSTDRPYTEDTPRGVATEFHGFKFGNFFFFRKEMFCNKAALAETT